MVDPPVAVDDGPYWVTEDVPFQTRLLIQVSALKDRSAALLGLIIKRHMKYLESKNLPAIAKDLKVR